MRKFVVSIDTVNASFEADGGAVEVARILKALARRVETEGCSGFYQNISDANGNVCGTFKAYLDREDSK